MRGTSSSRIGGVVVFASIAVVMIGGMAWATSATLELAKKNILDEYEGKIARAVNQVDNYMGGIRAVETLRAYTEYQPMYDKQPLVVWTRDGVQVSDAAVVQFASELWESGSPHDWVDLYFQVDPNNELSSPQVLDEPAPWLQDSTKSLWGCEPRICRTWDWLIRVFPSVDLRAAVNADAGAHQGLELADDAASAGTRHNSSAGRAGGKLAGFNRKRAPHLHIGQPRQSDCVEPEIAERNLLDRSRVPAALAPASPVAGKVEIVTGALARPFWVEPAPAEGAKLAFVRECTADASVFYQGFIGDWGMLKERLLLEVNALGEFESADLVPTDPDDEPAAGQVLTLPVRLVVPQIPGGVLGAAWNDVRGTLITSWVTAFAVLIVAGIGLRNLVLLTERRMRFAYAVTHELRTPLTTFRLYSDMLSAGLVPEEKKPEYLDTLHRESERLSALVEDVLEYARLENHKVRLSASSTKATALLDEIAETLKKRCQDHGVAPRSECGIANGLLIETDVDLVQRIAGVLLNNACRHASGSPDACVSVCLEGDEHELRLDVVDTGPGVARSELRAIFKPFRRGQNAEHTAQSGIGLGLALARDWARLLGGKLELVERHHAALGGAHFRLTIPTKLAR